MDLFTTPYYNLFDFIIKADRLHRLLSLIVALVDQIVDLLSDVEVLSKVKDEVFGFDLVCMRIET